MVVINNLNELAGLYDKDEMTGEITKVLRLFYDGDTVTFSRFDFYDDGNYKEATQQQLEHYQCTYYLEDGSRPLKSISCEYCHKSKKCFHNQKYYNFIK